MQANATFYVIAGLLGVAFVGALVIKSPLDEAMKVQGAAVPGAHHPYTAVPGQDPDEVATHGPINASGPPVVYGGTHNWDREAT